MNHWTLNLYGLVNAYPRWLQMPGLKIKWLQYKFGISRPNLLFILQPNELSKLLKWKKELERKNVCETEEFKAQGTLNLNYC